MKFRFIHFPISPSGAFPERTSVALPMIRVTIRHGDQSVDLRALIDSGAVHCMFPGDVGKDLGIDVRSGNKDKVIGLGNKVSFLYFHNIVLSIGGHENKIYAGFSDDAPMPLLGLNGFFDHYEVRLNHLKDQIIINPD